MGERSSDLSQADLLLGLAKACISCRTEEQFQDLVRVWVRPLLPHGLLAAVIGHVDMEHVEIRRFVGVDYPPAALRQLPMTLNVRERPVVARWLRTREPTVIDLPEDDGLVSARERYEIEAFGLGRLAIHGVVDMAARTGTYFSFGRVPKRLDRRAAIEALSLVTPPLHQALAALYLAASAGAESATAALSRAEREILSWVAAGRSNAEIARVRGRSVATIRNQIHSAYTKLGASSRSEAIRIMLGSPDGRRVVE